MIIITKKVKTTLVISTRNIFIIKKNNNLGCCEYTLTYYGDVSSSRKVSVNLEQVKNKQILNQTVECQET